MKTPCCRSVVLIPPLSLEINRQSRTPLHIHLHTMSAPDEAARRLRDDSRGSVVSQSNDSESAPLSYDLEFRTPATRALIERMKMSMLVLRVSYGTVAGVSESEESLPEETKQRCESYLAPFRTVFEQTERYTAFLNNAYLTENFAVAVALAGGAIAGRTAIDHLTGDRKSAYDATSILLDSFLRVSEMRDVSRHCRENGIIDTETIRAMWNMAARGDNVDDLIDEMEEDAARPASGDDTGRSPR
jgi:hypothetical protein